MILRRFAGKRPLVCLSLCVIYWKKNGQTYRIHFDQQVLNLTYQQTALNIIKN